MAVQTGAGIDLGESMFATSLRSLANAEAVRWGLTGDAGIIYLT